MSSRSHRGVPNPPPYPSPLNSTTQSQHTGQASGNTLAGRLPDHALAEPLPRSEGQYMTRYEHTPAKAEASAKRFDKRVDFYESAAGEYELPERKREYQEWVQSGRKKQDDPREREGRKIHTSGTTEPTSGSGGHPDTGYLNWEQTGRLREGMTTDQDGRHSREWAQGQAAYTPCDPNFVSAPSSYMQATSSNVSFHRPPSPGDEMPMPYEPIPHGYSQNHPWNYDDIGSGSGAAQEGASSVRPSRAASLAVPPASARGSRRDHGHGQGSSSRSGEGSRAHPSAQLQAAPLVYAPTGYPQQRAQPISQMQYTERGQSSHHGQSSHRSHTHGQHRSSNQRRRNKSDNGCCDVM